jgi:hypothetical protein
VIIAKGWPSWLEILPVISFQDVKVWYQEAGLLATYFDELHGNCIFDEVKDFSQISKFRRPILFILGSLDLGINFSKQRWGQMREGIQTQGLLLEMPQAFTSLP